ncbi:MAG: phage holin family protein [Candidatus Falkowbacteria bacterium]
MWFIKWILSAGAILLASYLVPGVVVQSFWTALWLSVIFGLVNVSLKPLLILLTLPITILTLGLFTLVIDASLMMLVSSLIKGFFVPGFWTALLFSLVLSIFNYVLNRLTAEKF